MDSQFFDHVETLEFESAEKCSCPNVYLQTRDLIDSANDSSGMCPHCNLPLANPEDSIQLPVDSGEVVGGPKKEYFPDPFIGKQLGDYVIHERIGSGGMARVYLARDQDLERHVAVKIIQNKNYVSLDTQAMLLRAEAITQASMHHPNVVGIYHVGSHLGLPYLTMEYVDGGSLMEKIKEGSLDFENILTYTKQIIEGLSEAYHIGLIHGDIKPANLLIDDCGHVKLSDFGLARHISDEDSVPKMLVGTPSFMAPELFELHPSDEKTDLFSLGVTLFEMSFGRVPYVLTGETIEEIHTSFKTAEIEYPETWPSSFPLWWKSILSRLLAKNRAERYSTIAEVEQDLKRFTQRPASARPFPKLSSFLLENLIFGFLCLPLVVILTEKAVNVGSNWNQWFTALAIAGPICFIVLAMLTGRTLGQLVSNTRWSTLYARPLKPIAMAKYQFLQLLPVECMVCGIVVLLLFGTAASLAVISVGIAVAIFHVIDVFVNSKKSTFLERVCDLQNVVDV